jgi:hypothetical protein
MGQNNTTIEVNKIIEVFNINLNKDQEFFNIIKDSIDTCINSKSIQNIEFLKKKSKSSTQQIIANHGTNKVFLKIFFYPEHLNLDNSLLMEAAIYTCVVPLLLKYNSPCFIVPIAYQECKGFFNQLIKYLDNPEISLLTKEKIRDLLVKYFGNNFFSIDNNLLKKRVCIIINEQSNDPTLLNTNISLNNTVTLVNFLSIDHSFETYMSILFQLIWTCYCFSMINLRHNDPHGSNIYVKQLPSTIQVLFIMNGIKFKVPIKYIIMFYDYDRSTVIPITKNTILDINYCEKGLGCNNKNNRYDIYKIMCDIKKDIMTYTPMFQLTSENKLFEDQKKQMFSLLKRFTTIKSKSINRPIITKSKEGIIIPKFNLQQEPTFDEIDLTKTSDPGEKFCLPPRKHFLIYDYPSNIFDFEDQELMMPNIFEDALKDDFFKSFTNFSSDEIFKIEYHLPTKEEKIEIQRKLLKYFPDIAAVSVYYPSDIPLERNIIIDENFVNEINQSIPLSDNQKVDNIMNDTILIPSFEIFMNKVKIFYTNIYSLLNPLPNEFKIFYQNMNNYLINKNISPEEIGIDTPIFNHLEKNIRDDPDVIDNVFRTPFNPIASIWIQELVNAKKMIVNFYKIIRLNYDFFIEIGKTYYPNINTNVNVSGTLNLLYISNRKFCILPKTIVEIKNFIIKNSS